jgi:hypothetical protein
VNPLACIEIASASPERFEDHGLQPIARIGWWIAAPCRRIRLLDNNDPAWLRQPSKLVHELRVSTHWREEETDMSEVERIVGKRGGVGVGL